MMIHHCPLEIRMKLSLVNDSRIPFFRLAITIACLCAGATTPALSIELPQPPVVQSPGRDLNVTMLATNHASTAIVMGTQGSGPDKTIQVDGLYLYKTGDCDACVAGLLPARIHTRQGQTINLQFRNRIGRSRDPEHDRLSNLHMHGLLVQPTHPLNGCGTHGDDIFVATALAPPNADCAEHGTHSMGDDQVQITTGPLQYKYMVPNDHPSGLLWYHPHPHGLSELQVGGGMAGLLTIGDFWDGAFISCAPEGTQAASEHPDKVCRTAAQRKSELQDRADVEERYLMLKDVQVASLANGRYQRKDPYDKGLCGAPIGSSTTVPNTHPGYCTDDGKTALWAFTVNGTVYPTITVAPGKTHVWRIANASADITYRLRLVVTSQGGPVPAGTALPLKVLAQDGATVTSFGRATQAPRNVVMMPSARTEILIDPCTIGLGAINSRGECQLPANPITAVLQTIGTDVAASPGGADIWPAIQLAEVVFPGKSQAPLVTPKPVDTVAPTLPADALAPLPASDTASAIPNASLVRSQLPCSPDVLPDNKVRVIRFKNGVLPDGVERFGLRAETSRMTLPDGSDRIVLPQISAHPDLATDYSEVTDVQSKARLCIKYGSKEQWVLINDSEECHNFHIHQVRFKVRRIQAGGTPADAQCLGNRADSIVNDAWHDNFPLPPGARVLIDIAFDRPAQIGKFVYHCHILEHEDSGMMAAVEVVK